MAKTANMRGLKMFITDIRNCKNHEEEEERVDKELANIRSKFKNPSNLTEYDKKKYVWKLLYIHMLGYDVEFGHVQAIDLISAAKFKEKQVGYMVTSVLVNENNEFLRLSINATRNDIISRNESFQCLALAFAANVGGSEFSEALASDVCKLLVANTSRPVIKKKAALCLLRLFRKNPDILTADLWAVNMATLLEERDLGVLQCSVTLLTAIAARDASGYESCVPKLVAALERLARARGVPQDHTYYGIPSPWLQIRIMRCLQYFGPPDDPDLCKALVSVVQAVLTGTDVVKNVNKNNASHAVLFEALALVIHLDMDRELLGQCLSLLGKFIAVKEPNIRYLGLENMCRVALIPDCLPTIRRHLRTILNSLKEADISIRRRALDLLFTMCDQTNAKEIVSELLAYLREAEFGMREELALKIAILAEKFAPDLLWYVDVAMGLVETAGEYISEDIWFRVVQLVTNNRDMQEHAVRHMFDALVRGVSAEPLIATAAYILGEFSRIVPDVSDADVYNLLVDKIPVVALPIKGIILNAFAKIALHAQDLGVKADIEKVFVKYQRFMDAELQQRAIEYSALAKKTDMKESVLGLMPAYPERESSLLKRLAAGTGAPINDTSAQDEDLDISAISSGLGTSISLAAPHGSNGVADLIGGLDLEDGAHPTAEARAVASSDPMSDLLSLQGGPAVQSQKAQPAQADPFSAAARGMDDLLGGNSGPPDRPITPLGDIRVWHRKLVAAQQGVLYEDDCLQIGVRQEYRGSDARIMLFLGNKGTSPIENFQLMVAPSATFKVQLMNPAPQMLLPKTQQQVVVMVGASGPSLETPVLSLKYSLGSQKVAQQLSLPCVNTKFMTPVQGMQGPEFFGAWQAIPGPPLKVQEIVSRPHPLSPVQVGTILSTINFGILSGLDPNTNNVVVAAKYTVAVGFNPLVMCRIEVEPNAMQQFRVTVASGDTALSSTIKEIIKHQLLAV